MNIILFTKEQGRIACIECKRHWLVGLVLIPVLLVIAGYHLGKAYGQKQPNEIISTWDNSLSQQQQKIDEAIRTSGENMNALALQLGKMQAHVIRLDALGQRLTKIAKLDKGEFNFDRPPAIGGPGSEGNLPTISVPNFMSTLADLSKQVNDRSQQMEVLETMLMNHNLQAEVLPAGRPVSKGWVSSFFGMRTDPFTGRQDYHKGIDIAGKAGSKVFAVASGVVSFAGERNSYGNMVEINHGNGYVTRYGHNKKILVKSGDKVEKGQPLALMGSSGRSTGPHVHYEVLLNGRVVNPSKFINASR